MRVAFTAITLLLVALLGVNTPLPAAPCTTVAPAAASQCKHSCCRTKVCCCKLNAPTKPATPQPENAATTNPLPEKAATPAMFVVPVESRGQKFAASSELFVAASAAAPFYVLTHAFLI